MTGKARFKINEIALRLGIREPLIVRFVENEWILPVDPRTNEFDEEDLARCQLIHELLDDFGVNDEAIPIILDLIDRIHHLQAELEHHHPEFSKAAG